MPRKYHLHLTGYVGRYTFDSEFVSWKVNQTPDKLDVLIESRGGSLFHGLAISSAFARHGNAHVHFVGFNASAATIASMGAKRISMDENAMYLVHQCSYPFFLLRSLNGDQLKEQIKSMEKTQRELAAFDNNVASLYAKRCKKTKDELLALMKKETWLSAHEALEWGFIDEVTSHREDKKPELTNAIKAEFVENHIPLPIMSAGSAIAEPTDPSTMLDKIKNFFKQTTNNTRNMNLECTHFCAASGLTAVESSADNKVSISSLAILKADAKLDTLSSDLANAQNRIAELTAANASLSAEIKDLKEAKAAAEEEDNKKPGEKSDDVVDDADTDKSEDDEYSDFFKTHSEAQALFNSLP